MLIVAGLVAAFILILIFSKPGSRACRWRRDRNRDGPDSVFWRCVACGAERCTGGAAPKRCLRGG